MFKLTTVTILSLSLLIALYLIGLTLNFYFSGLPIIAVVGVVTADFFHTKWLKGKLEGENWARARFYKAGYVYIALGNNDQWMKVGFSEIYPEDRELSLNTQKHAGINDWHIEYYRNSEHAGRLENVVQQQLRDIRVSSKELPPRKIGGVGSREVFYADISRAIETIEKRKWTVMLRYGLFRALKFQIPVIVAILVTITLVYFAD